MMLELIVAMLAAGRALGRADDHARHRQPADRHAGRRAARDGRDRASAYPEEEVDCAYWRAPQWPGLAMMVSGGRVVRIETEDPRYRTASGARVGMAEAEIRAIYGARMRVEPHPYTGRRAIIWSIGRAASLTA